MEGIFPIIKAVTTPGGPVESSSVEEICSRNAIFQQAPEQEPVFVRGFQLPNVSPPPDLYGGLPVLN